MNLDEIKILKSMINSQQSNAQNTAKNNYVTSKNKRKIDTQFNESEESSISNKKQNLDSTIKFIANQPNTTKMSATTEEINSVEMESDEKEQQKEKARLNRRKRNTNMYRDTQNNFVKPNTIVFALDQNKIKVLKGVNLEKIIVTQTGAEIRDAQIRVNKCYIYPRTQRDYEAIWSNKDWEFAKNESWSLENRDFMVIITQLGIEDIEYNTTIKHGLTRMGIIK